MYELASGPEVLSSAHASSTATSNTKPVNALARSRHVAMRLMTLAVQCRKQGMSGRALRRLPVLALADYIGVMPARRTGTTGKSSPETEGRSGTEVEIWLDGMEKVVNEQASQLKKFSTTAGT